MSQGKLAGALYEGGETGAHDDKNDLYVLLLGLEFQAFSVISFTEISSLFHFLYVFSICMFLFDKFDMLNFVSLKYTACYFDTFTDCNMIALETIYYLTSL